MVRQRRTSDCGKVCVKAKRLRQCSIGELCRRQEPPFDVGEDTSFIIHILMKWHNTIVCSKLLRCSWKYLQGKFVVEGDTGFTSLG